MMIIIIIIIMIIIIIITNVLELVLQIQVTCNKSDLFYSLFSLLKMPQNTHSGFPLVGDISG